MINTVKKFVAKRREELAENDKGFTLIELLVVVLIIGILAAIAIPAFLSQREGAWVSAVESDLKNAALAAETYLVENDGSYENFDPNGAATVNGGFNPSPDLTVTFAATGNTYTIVGNHDELTQDYTYNSETGRITP